MITGMPMTVLFLPASLRASGFGIVDGAGARASSSSRQCACAPRRSGKPLASAKPSPQHEQDPAPHAALGFGCRPVFVLGELFDADCAPLSRKDVGLLCRDGRRNRTPFLAFGPPCIIEVGIFVRWRKRKLDLGYDKLARAN